MTDEANFGEAVKKLIGRIEHLAGPDASPAQFARSLHGQWKALGGRVAGKPRHSDRYLEDQLRAKGTPVKSLTPKLVGKTHIGPTDADILVRFFLANWPHPGTREEDVDYKPVLSDAEIDAVAQHVQTNLPERSIEGFPAFVRHVEETERTLPGEATADLIVRHYRDSDALITVSPEHLFVPAGPRRELIGFRGLMDMLWDVELRDRRKRALIWVTDLGTSHLDDESTRKKYLNVQQLIIRFKALSHYKDSRSEGRLAWLRERAAIVLLDTYGEWGEDVVSTRRPDFSSHHATLSNPNPDWMADANFRALYGSNLERVQERVMSVFFNASGQWQTAPHLNTDLRYFGFSTFKNSKNEDEARGLELAPLPLRYADAFRNVCAAAAKTLGLNIPKAINVNDEEAVKQLSYLGFRVLPFEDLIAMY